MKIKKFGKTSMFLATAALAGVPNQFVQAQVLEEVIVTAQKQEQNLQTVPISVTAFTSADLEKSGIRNADQLQAYTPGLTIGTVSGQVSATYIRGGGTGQFDPGADPAVAYFIDEVYVTGNTALQFELLDVERIEVLKGPQGTLYGRNASAGAISFYSKKPEDEFSAAVLAEAQNYDGYRLRASVTGPITDSVSYRLAGTKNERDGYMKNLDPGGDQNPGSVDQYGFRGALSFEFGEDVDLLLSADYGSSDNGMTMVSNALDGIAFQSPLVAPLTEGQDFWHRYMDLDGGVENEFSNFSATLNWTTGLGTLTSITGYRDNATERLHDQDASSLDSLYIFTTEDTTAFSQEIRLADSGEKFDWLVGLYYYDADIGGVTQIDFGLDSIVGLILGGPAFNTNDHALDVESTSVFGQATYRFSDKLSLTFGGRYTSDEKTSDRSNRTDLPVNLNFAADYDINIDESWSNFSPMLGLDYYPTEDTLVYLSWRNGYKSGSFQSLANLEGLALVPYDEEIVESWELGAKSSFMDNRVRLNAALFYVQYDDLQKTHIDETGLGVIIDNVGEATAQGIDLSLDFAATESMTLAIRYGYLDTEYKEYVNGSGNDLSGNTLSKSPESQFSFIADYNLPVGEFELDFRAEYSYVDETFLDDENTVEVDGVRVNRDDYSLVNARMSLAPTDNQWRLSVWGKNLSDEEICGNGLIGINVVASPNYSICYPMPPRTYGATLEWFL